MGNSAMKLASSRKRKPKRVKIGIKRGKGQKKNINQNEKGKKGERRKDLRDKNCRGKRNRKKSGAGRHCKENY
jgi:hypothetical protein